MGSTKANLKTLDVSKRCSSREESFSEDNVGDFADSKYYSQIA